MNVLYGEVLGDTASDDFGAEDPDEGSLVPADVFVESEGDALASVDSVPTGVESPELESDAVDDAPELLVERLSFL